MQFGQSIDLRLSKGLVRLDEANEILHVEYQQGDAGAHTLRLSLNKNVLSIHSPFDVVLWARG